VGSNPGPACYGLCGTEPTVADANLVLGYMEDGRRLGGSVVLDAAKAEAAFRPLAHAFGTSVVEAALGVRRVANANMTRALRRVTVEHGIDARSCALMAYGGQGPMHAVSLAREFDIRKVIVPRFSSGFSAFGCLSADLSYAEQRPLHMASTAWDVAALAAMIDGIAARLKEPLLSGGTPPGLLKVEVAGLLRYHGQSDAVEVALEPPYALDRVDAGFKATHQRLYGFATDERWEIDTLRVTVRAPHREGALTLAEDHAAPGREPVALRRCWFEGPVELDTPHYDRDRLPAEWRIEGPAIIEDAWSTTVVDPGATAWADALGHLHIDLEAPAT